MDKRNARYSPEVQERSVRLVLEHQHEHASQWAAIESLAGHVVGVPSLASGLSAILRSNLRVQRSVYMGESYARVEASEWGSMWMTRRLGGEGPAPRDEMSAKHEKGT